MWNLFPTKAQRSLLKKTFLIARKKRQKKPISKRGSNPSPKSKVHLPQKAKKNSYDLDNFLCKWRNHINIQIYI